MNYKIPRGYLRDNLNFMKLFKLWTEKEYEDLWIDLDSLDDAKIDNVSATFSQAVDKYLIASQVS